jgi:hypothetical protein
MEKENMRELKFTGLYELKLQPEGNIVKCCILHSTQKFVECLICISKHNFI